MTRANGELFLEEVSPFQHEWTGLEVRWASVRGPEMERAVLFRLLVRPLWDPPPDADMPPDVPGIAFGQEILEQDALASLIAGVQAGNLLVGGQELEVAQRDGNPSFSFYRDEHGEGGTTFQLTADFDLPNHLRPDEHEVDRGLRCADPPWDGMSDVAENFLPTGRSDSHRLYKAVIAFDFPVGITVPQPILSNDDLLIAVNGHARMDANAITLGLLAPGLARKDRYRYLASEILEKHETNTLSLKLPWNSQWDRASLYVHYRGAKLAHHVVVRPKDEAVVRLAMLDLYAQPEEALDVLFNEKYLETWAHLLLHSIGYACAYMGGPKGRFPDALAVPPGNEAILVVECTQGQPNNGGKLAKLHERARRLHQHAGRETLPVLMTFVSRSDVAPSEWDAAHQNDVALLVRENLEELHAMARAGSDPRALEQYLRGKVPRGRSAPGLPGIGGLGRRLTGAM